MWWNEKEITIQNTFTHYQNSKKQSIKVSAERFGVPYSNLRGRLGGVQVRVKGHSRLQALTKYKEKVIPGWLV